MNLNYFKLVTTFYDENAQVTCLVIIMCQTIVDNKSFFYNIYMVNSLNVLFDKWYAHGFVNFMP